MTYNANGQLIFTAIAGTSYTGLYNANGSYNVVLTTENTTWKGIYHPCGAYWGSVATTSTSYYAIDGSINIINNGDGTYSPLIPVGGTKPASNESLDFVNGVYKYNGVTYPSFSAFLAGTGATFTRASSGYDMAASTSFTSNVARITSVGLLLEPAATNIATQSALATGWSTDAGTLTPAALAAPDGTATAAQLVEDTTATTGHDSVVHMASALAAVKYNFSAFHKRNVGTRNAYLVLFDSAFANQVNAGFDLGTGLPNTTPFASGFSGVTSTSYSAANSYLRTLLSFTATVTASFWPKIALLSGTTALYTGDGVSANAQWGVQVETAAATGYFAVNPSSYIPTTTVPASRAADVLTLTVPVGKTNALVTFDDNSTQSFTGLSGTWVVPTGTGLNRPLVTSINFT